MKLLCIMGCQIYDIIHVCNYYKHGYQPLLTMPFSYKDEICTLSYRYTKN